MSSDTCQNFLRLGAAEAGRVDRREGEACIVDEDVHAVKPRQCNGHDTVAIGGPA
jgi:hypothetical protein